MKYNFRQDRNLITLERTHFSIEAESEEEAIEIVRGMPEAAVNLDESFGHCFEMGYSETFDESAVELSPEQNKGNATLITYLDDEELFDNLQDECPQSRDTIRDIIEDILAEGPLAQIYFLLAVNALKQQVDEMSDEEIIEMTEHLIGAGDVRHNIAYIFRKVNKIPKPENNDSKNETQNDNTDIHRKY